LFNNDAQNGFTGQRDKCFGLGVTELCGRSLVPAPATGMIAFINLTLFC